MFVFLFFEFVWHRDRVFAMSGVVTPSRWNVSFFYPIKSTCVECMKEMCRNCKVNWVSHICKLRSTTEISIGQM